MDIGPRYCQQSVPNDLNSGREVPAEDYADENYDPDHDVNLRRCSSIRTVWNNRGLASISVFYDAEWIYNCDLKKIRETPSSRLRAWRLLERLRSYGVIGTKSFDQLKETL
jgi:hypothetical protein